MEKSKARVICNPSSGGGYYDPDEIRDELEGLEVDWVQTEGPEDAIGAAEEWSEGLLIVAGGDGTINDVVNGLGRAGFPEGVTLGILPTGTGNDLAATLAVPDDLELAEDVIRQKRVRRLDVARVRSEGVGE
ncbi:MAG TPA: acylglycerol kinase family protein, partial [Rubrobacter sp.]